MATRQSPNITTTITADNFNDDNMATKQTPTPRATQLSPQTVPPILPPPTPIKKSASSLLIHPHEIPVYIQRPSLRFDDLLGFVTFLEPARFNVSKPPLLHSTLSDDTWAALKLRVDPLARDLLDPHRSYAAAFFVALLIGAVFWAVRPGVDTSKVRARMGYHGMDDYDDDYRKKGLVGDDAIFDDYFEDDEWERIHHHIDDVVLAELEYLNGALDRSFFIWRVGLIVSLVILFGSVVFIAILMEKRNGVIDKHIREVVEEIRPRVEGEGVGVEYRTRSSQTGVLFFVGKYIRPTRVVVFWHLAGGRAAEMGTGDSLLQEGGGGEGGRGHKTKKTASFFSEDYQRKYFGSNRIASRDDFTVASSTFSLM
ncbi:hypothetical protein ACHAXS_003835 [Conticribra weissflogii]